LADALRPETVVRLWDEHGPALVLYAQQLCDAPEDVVQEAFLLLVRQGRALENPVGWLYRVVRNRALNAARSRSRKSRREAVAAARHEPWFETAAGEGLDAAEASAALKQLPTDQREVIVARLWGGLSFEEVSRLQGASLSTVYRCYQRGLAALRERIGESCLTTRKTPASRPATNP
jgi:RNA polymerase sigma factor (sigma-70 family)